MAKVDHIHEIDDGTKSDDVLAKLVGCHVAYVRAVRLAPMRRAALQYLKSEKRKRKTDEQILSV